MFPSKQVGIGAALEHVLKHGNGIAWRLGWNGKNQWIRVWEGDSMKDGEKLRVFALHNTQGKMQLGWVPSQGDMFADDWVTDFVISAKGEIE